MSTIYTPKVGSIIVPETIKEKTVKGVLNALPVGTRIRATSGENVLVGRVGVVGPHELIDITLEAAGYDHLRNYNLWLNTGWTFEILDEPFKIAYSPDPERIGLPLASYQDGLEGEEVVPFDRVLEKELVDA
jgi:hypothetical protein